MAPVAGDGAGIALLVIFAEVTAVRSGPSADDLQNGADGRGTRLQQQPFQAIVDHLLLFQIDFQLFVQAPALFVKPSFLGHIDAQAQQERRVLSAADQRKECFQNADFAVGTAIFLLKRQGSGAAGLFQHLPVGGEAIRFPLQLGVVAADCADCRYAAELLHCPVPDDVPEIVGDIHHRDIGRQVVHQCAQQQIGILISQFITAAGSDFPD